LPTAAICTRYLHDALPIYVPPESVEVGRVPQRRTEAQDVARLTILHRVPIDQLRRLVRHHLFDELVVEPLDADLVELLRVAMGRSEEHTSELQSRENLVCR